LGEGHIVSRKVAIPKAFGTQRVSTPREK